jgi:hypothetical protein
MRPLVLLLFVAGCGSPPVEQADLGVADSCAPPISDAGGCDSSNDCPRATGCFAGACTPVAACAPGCAACTLDRVCDGQTCRAPAGQLCAPCSDDCAMAGGLCRSSYCATRCDDTRTFCPRGFRCDIPGGKTSGYCVPALATGCAGCAADGDCPPGEVCNVNNRRCIPAPTGADARLEMSALDFLYPDDQADGGTVYKKARNLTWSLGFFAYRDPSFDPYALAADSCASERSTFDLHAPFPLGPMRDAGDPLTLTLPMKSIAFARVRDDNPAFGFTYSESGLMVVDWTPGAASWAGTGGADVGPFTADGAIPPEYTTTPDLLDPTPITADADAGITLTFDAPAPAGVRSYLEVSYNESSGNTVTALTRIACRAPDGARTVTVPGKLLANVPRSAGLGLIVTRATVVDFTARGVALGRAVFGMQKVGEVIVAP